MESPRSHRKLHRSNSADKAAKLRSRAKRLANAKSLASLGFPLQVCMSTLERFGGDKEKAANWLVNNEKSIHFEENLKSLMTMGFTRMVCREALEKSKGDVEVAARLILERDEKGGGETSSYTIQMRKDSKGRLGVVMDHNLTIIGVNSWARQFGAQVGMKVLKCHGSNVRTTAEVKRVHENYVRKGGQSDVFNFEVTILDEQQRRRRDTLTEQEQALVSMGFPLDQCRTALRMASDMDVENDAKELRVAMELLLSGRVPSSSTTETPVVVRGEPLNETNTNEIPQVAISVDAMKVLRDMGFDENECTSALQRSHNNLNSAIELLTVNTLPPPPKYDMDISRPPAYEKIAQIESQRKREDDFRRKHAKTMESMPPRKVRHMFENMKPQRWEQYLNIARAHIADDNTETKKKYTKEVIDQEILDTLRPVCGDGWTSSRQSMTSISESRNDEDDMDLDIEEDLKEPPPSSVSVQQTQTNKLADAFTSLFKKRRGNSGGGTRNVILGHLESYDDELRKALRRRRTLFRQVKEYDRLSKKEWIKIRKRLRDWGKDSLLTVFERRQLLREQRHDALKQFHRTVGKLFSDRILEVSALEKTLIAISKTGEQKLPQISDEFFLEPHQLLNRDPSSKTLKEFMVQLTQRLRQSDAEIAKLKERLHLPSNEERVASMRSLVENIISSKLTKNHFTTFRSILHDSRTEQGRLWKRWSAKLLQNSTDKSSFVSRVPVFVKYLADVLGYDFDLEKEEELKVLRGLTERLLHTDLQDRCVSFFVEECGEKDKEWRQAIEDVASHCSAFDFGVERRFCRSESSWRCRLNNTKETARGNIPFSRAAKILRGFTETNRMIPSELLESLLGAVRAIHEEAVDVCAGAMLTAEDVLPIMVFITVQAKLSTPHLALRYCEAYSKREGEAAYYLCMLESAVAHVSSMQDEEEVEESTTIPALEASSPSLIPTENKNLPHLIDSDHRNFDDHAAEIPQKIQKQISNESVDHGNLFGDVFEEEEEEEKTAE